MFYYLYSTIIHVSSLKLPACVVRMYKSDLQEGRLGGGGGCCSDGSGDIF